MAGRNNISSVERRAGNISWLVYTIAVIGVATLFFASVTEHGLDDHDADSFYDNARISQDFSYFFSPERHLITGRPAADLSRWLASLVLGDSAANFHLLVVAAHVLAVLLLARLVNALHRDCLWAWCSGLLFLVNVTHFQAVHWISALDYPLSLCWGLGALLLFLHYEETGVRSALVSSYMLFAIGVLTHMSVVVLGPLCLYWLWWRSDNRRAAILRVAPLGAMLAVLLLYCLTITPKATSTWSAIDHYDVAEVSIFSSLHLLAWFGGRLLSTAHWVPPLAVYEQQPWEMYFGVVVLVGVVAMSWCYRRQSVGWVLWVILGLSPFLFIPEDLILKFLPGGPSRYLYLASAGSSVLIALGLVQVSNLMGKWGEVVLSLVIVLVSISSYAGIKRVEGFSHYTSARHHLASGNSDEGIYRLRRAIDEGGSTIPLQDAYERLVLATMVQPTRAASIVEESLALFPDSVPINIYRILLHSLSTDTAVQNDAVSRLGELGSIAEAREVIGVGYLNLANGLNHRGQVVQAIEAYERSLSFLPDKAVSLKALGKVLVLQGRFEEGMVVIERLLEVDDADYQMQYVLGKLYSMRGDGARARRMFSRVLQLAPQSMEADEVRKLQ